jgi:hypothetical protein
VPESGGKTKDYSSLFNIIEKAATSIIRLDPEQTKEVVASVLVDFWTLLQESPKKAASLLCDENQRDE